MEQAQQNIDNMVLRAPMDGLVSVKEAQVNFFFTGMIVPELRAGDVVWPGKTIAEILEVEQMEILAKVSESDRGNINPGQNIEVRVDALPGRLFTGRVKNVAGMAARGGWWGTSSAERKFDATFELNGNGLELRPGATAEVIIVGEQVRNALYLPRQAFFEKDGKPVVYVRQGENFEPREVKILKRTESQIALEGLKEGDEVALVNPEQRRRGPAKAAGPVTPKAGG
jgi:multidrug efflux pump subunit AcrA (membrane-fusion protein)